MFTDIKGDIHKGLVHTLGVVDRTFTSHRTQWTSADSCTRKVGIGPKAWYP